MSYSVLYGYTQWLEDGRGLTPQQTGLVLLPMFGLAIVVSTLTGRNPQLFGKLLAGGLVQLVAGGMMLILDDHSPIWLLTLVTLVYGVPQGLLNLANQNAVYRQADAGRMGTSAGLLRTFMYLGAITAATVNGLFLGPSADAHDLHEIGLFSLSATVLALALTLSDRTLRSVPERFTEATDPQARTP